MPQTWRNIFMTKIGLFIDTGDQFFRVNQRWPESKLNYRKYYDVVSKMGEIVSATAYGTQIGPKSDSFIEYLEIIGFKTSFKTIVKGKWFNWSVGMSIDIVNAAHELDLVVIGTSIREMADVLTHLKSVKVNSLLFGCGINKELKLTTDTWREIDKYLLQ